jgi:hypothetical protein
LNNNEKIFTDFREKDFLIKGDAVGLEIDLKVIQLKTQIKQLSDLVYVIATSGTTGQPKIISVCNSSIWPNILDLRLITLGPKLFYHFIFFSCLVHFVFEANCLKSLRTTRFIKHLRLHLIQVSLSYSLRYILEQLFLFYLNCSN